MGQAKNRGTQEQRIAMAMEREAAALEVLRQQKALADIKRRQAEADRRERGQPRVAVVGGSHRLSTVLIGALAVGLSSSFILPPRKEKPWP